MKWRLIISLKRANQLWIHKKSFSFNKNRIQIWWKENVLFILPKVFLIIVRNVQEFWHIRHSVLIMICTSLPNSLSLYSLLHLFLFVHFGYISWVFKEYFTTTFLIVNQVSTAARLISLTLGIIFTRCVVNTYTRILLNFMWSDN